MTEDNTGSDVGQIPELVEKYTRAVKEEVNIPVISKLTPNVASPLPAAIAAKNGGADGIAAINTIKSITEFNIIDSLYNKKLGKNIAVGGLSGTAVKPIALKFIAEIAKVEELKNLHISAMGGIYTYEDAIMFLALGASSLQVTTAVMEYGYRIIDDLINGLELFLGTVGLHSLSELKGGLINNVVNIEKIERDYVIYPKFIRNTCVGCGRCYISCLDGGHQAIKFENRIPILDPKKCVGCHLCVLVCPTSSIVSSEIKIKK
jgi:dihydropyrimidine dehydrogenase (NAD+) subunit PreA